MLFVSKLGKFCVSAFEVNDLLDLRDALAVPFQPDKTRPHLKNIKMSAKQVEGIRSEFGDDSVVLRYEFNNLDISSFSKEINEELVLGEDELDDFYSENEKAQLHRSHAELLWYLAIARTSEALQDKNPSPDVDPKLIERTLGHETAGVFRKINFKKQSDLYIERFVKKRLFADKVLEQDHPEINENLPIILSNAYRALRIFGNSYSPSQLRSLSYALIEYRVYLPQDKDLFNEVINSITSVDVRSYFETAMAFMSPNNVVSESGDNIEKELAKSVFKKAQDAFMVEDKTDIVTAVKNIQNNLGRSLAEIVTGSFTKNGIVEGQDLDLLIGLLRSRGIKVFENIGYQYSTDTLESARNTIKQILIKMEKGFSAAFPADLQKIALKAMLQGGERRLKHNKMFEDYNNALQGIENETNQPEDNL